MPDTKDMKICVIGAPSTGKSIFARTLSAQMSKQGLNCELIQEYASQYIQQVGAPKEAWEELVISVNQHMSEQNTNRDHLITDGSAFATFIYAQHLIPARTNDAMWPKHRHLLDLLRTLARDSVSSYDLIFLMTHIFPPKRDGVRLTNHLDLEQCTTINEDLEKYMQTERIEFHRLKANDKAAVNKAMNIIQQRILIQVPV